MMVHPPAKDKVRHHRGANSVFLSKQANRHANRHLHTALGIKDGRESGQSDQVSGNNYQMGCSGVGHLAAGIAITFLVSDCPLTTLG